MFPHLFRIEMNADITKMKMARLENIPIFLKCFTSASIDIYQMPSEIPQLPAIAAYIMMNNRKAANLEVELGLPRKFCCI
jgi:hypothetical protein